MMIWSRSAVAANAPQLNAIGDLEHGIIKLKIK